MPWIYFSPHFDDVALSCGGLVWEQAQAGNAVGVWTVCAGKPPSRELSLFAQVLHTRWQAEQEATEERRMEDLLSCLVLGVGSRYFNIPDCIYRREPHTGEFLYTSEAALNGPIQPGDTQVITALQEQLKPFISDEMELVSPLSLGNHVDHQLTRLALEGLGCISWYYQDYPYVVSCREQADRLESEGWVSQVHPVSEQGLAAWQDSIAVHTSQISTFWPGENEMRQAITDYLGWYGGIRLWRKPTQ